MKAYRVLRNAGLKRVKLGSIGAFCRSLEEMDRLMENAGIETVSQSDLIYSDSYISTKLLDFEMIWKILKKVLRKGKDISDKVSELRSNFTHTIRVKEYLKRSDVEIKGEAFKTIVEGLRRKEDYLELEL